MSLPMASLASYTSSAAAVSASATLPAAVIPSASAAWWSSVAQSQRWVGSAWILSSALLTTYSTTAFLKYDGEEEARQGGGGIWRHFGVGALRQPQQPQQQPHPQGQRPREEGKASRGPAALSRASLLTLYRFSGSLLLGLLVHRHFYQPAALAARFLQTARASRAFLLPALLLFVANYTNSVALDRVGISLTYTSKCGIPLVTVLLTLLLDGPAALPSRATLASLLPIAAGVGAASWNLPTFEGKGFAAALASTTSQAALNVASKRAMRRTGVRGPAAQRATVLAALGLGLVTAGAARGALAAARGAGAGGEDASEAVPDEAPTTTAAVPPPPWLAGLAALAYHVEYVLSFTFVGLVEPVTYGACDALRRLLIILTGRRMFGGDPLSALNVGGIATALLGALAYALTSGAAGGGQGGGVAGPAKRGY